MSMNFIDICTLNSCCYRCAYCISKSINAYYQTIDNERIHFNSGWSLKPVPLMNFIRNQFKPEDTVLQLSGGEPLLWEPLPYVMKEIIDLGFRFGINTNGYKIKQFLAWKNVLHNPVDDDKDFVMKWRVSWHPHCRSFELFKQDIAPLLSIPRSVLINYVVHPQHIENGYIDEHIQALEEFTAQTGIRHERTPMQGHYNGNDYNKFDHIYEKYLTVPGPAIKVNYFSILGNGEIRKCHRMPLGSIYDGKFIARNFDSDGVCVMPNGSGSACGALSAYGILGII